MVGTLNKHQGTIFSFETVMVNSLTETFILIQLNKLRGVDSYDKRTEIKKNGNGDRRKFI